MPCFALFYKSIRESKLDISHPHTSDFHKIFIFEKSGGTHHIDNTNYPVCGYSLHFVPKKTVHYLHNVIEYCELCFTDNYFETCAIKKNNIDALPFFKPLASGYILDLEKETFIKIAFLLDEIYREYESKQNGKRRCEIVQTLIHRFLLECERHVFNKPENQAIPPILIKLMDAIEKNYKKRLSVEKYASMLFISISQLNRLCKATFQKTTQELIHERGLKEAQKLLIYTKKSIKWIAWDLGFERVASFIDFFIRKTGMSPSQFRKNNA